MTQPVPNLNIKSFGAKGYNRKKTLHKTNERTKYTNTQNPRETEEKKTIESPTSTLFSIKSDIKRTEEPRRQRQTK